MRIEAVTPAAFKKAAKLLTNLTPDRSLAGNQELLARALGYRDYHELAQARPSLPLGSSESIERAANLIGRLADLTGRPDSDIQYVVERSRLLQSVGPDLQTSLRLRARLWRDRLFGAPGRNRPGTIVRVRSGGKPIHAILRFGGRPSAVIYDRGLGEVADFEVVTPRQPLADFIPSRLWLPYGFWQLADGSRVVFSRDYYPMWRLLADRVERLDPWLWITGRTSEHWFSDGSSSPWELGEARENALRFLDGHRVRSLPRLVESMRELMDPTIHDLDHAVARLADRLGRGETPAFAQLNSRILQP